MGQGNLSLLELAAKRGKAWILSIDAIDPTGADDHFVHMRNTGARSLAIVAMELMSTVAGFVEPFRASGTASNTPTAVTPRSLAGPGGAAPVGTFETGVDLVMTIGDLLGFFYLAANTPRPLEVYYVIPPATGIAFNWSVATGVLSGHVILVELAQDEDPVD